VQSLEIEPGCWPSAVPEADCHSCPHRFPAARSFSALPLGHSLMMSESPAKHPMDELEIRQDEIILKLDELNARIEQTLAQWLVDGNAAA